MYCLACAILLVPVERTVRLLFSERGRGACSFLAFFCGSGAGYAASSSAIV
jgi:hypothetical protein